jgi:serine/threonine protein kinase
MPLATGVRLGPYEILAPLGAGGMGEVYRATDTRLGRTVAVKVLPHHLAYDPQRRERFEREARAVSSLNHPHICTLHDIGEQDGLHYLVMEYVEGETLAARLDRGRPPLDQALAYAIQIAEAHGKGVVHRDLKPGNVMVTRAGVKLLEDQQQGRGSGGGLRLRHQLNVEIVRGSGGSDGSGFGVRAGPAIVLRRIRFIDAAAAGFEERPPPDLITRPLTSASPARTPATSQGLCL